MLFIPCISEILKGQVVWITGSSTGIGEYLAYELAKVGCRLVLSARNEDLLEAVKRKCRGEQFKQITKNEIVTLYATSTTNLQI